MKLNIGKLLTGAIKTAAPFVVPVVVAAVTAHVEKAGEKVLAKSRR